MPEQNWLQKILSGTFDQRGGTWVGLSTFTVVLMAWVEFVMSGIRRPILNAAGLPIVQDNVVLTMPGWHPYAPAWWVVGATCIFVVILGFFVMSKSGTYFVDSKYNSPPAQPPGAGTKTGGSATLPAILFLLALSVLGTVALAETFYCVPKDGGLLCKPVDFEHRQFDMTPPEVSSRGYITLPNPYLKSFRCYGKGETYKCLPFDDGAVLLETPKTCPESNRNWWNVYTTDVGVMTVDKSGQIYWPKQGIHP